MLNLFISMVVGIVLWEIIIKPIASKIRTKLED